MSIDPGRFITRFASPRGVRLAYVREGEGGVPLVLVHGWPETKRVYWKVIAPLADAGFDVIVPDLRGFGESDIGDDPRRDPPMFARDIHSLVHEELGLERVVLAGGDLGGPVVQDISLRFPEFVDRMVLFNSPLPYNAETMTGMRTRGFRASMDYYQRQGNDADALAAELRTPAERRRYIATFYTSRYWAHGDNFSSEEVDFHTEPFADGDKLRASFSPYEAVYDADKRSEAPMVASVKINPTFTMILFGPSDHVLFPDFDRMAAVVFPDHAGPFLLRDCGHFVPWEAPHAFVTAVRAHCGDLIARHSG
ncbi:MAG: alpha/beta fold hydrolase [Acidimicrobiia bacterium]